MYYRTDKTFNQIESALLSGKKCFIVSNPYLTTNQAQQQIIGTTLTKFSYIEKITSVTSIDYYQTRIGLSTGSQLYSGYWQTEEQARNDYLYYNDDIA